MPKLNYKPTIEIELEKIPGGVVEVRQRLTEGEIRSCEDENMEKKLDNILLISIVGWNLTDDKDAVNELNIENIRQLPAHDLKRILSYIMHGDTDYKKTDEQRKNEEAKKV